MNSFGAIAAVPLIFRSLACARFSECRYAAKTRSGENNLDASDLGMEVAVEKKNAVFAIPAHYYPGAWNTLFFPQLGL